MKRLVKRFSRTALIVWGIAVAAAALLFSKHIAIGVLVGGALGLLNVRGMARGVTGLDINDPKPARLFFGGAVRLVVLCVVIVLIAMTKKVDLVGLLAGFTLMVFTVVAEGVREMRLIVKDEGEQNMDVLFSDGWIDKTKRTMPVRSLWNDVFKDLDGPGSIYINTLRTYFDRFPLSKKQKKHMKSLLESQNNVDHLGAANELIWYEFMKSTGLDVMPLPVGNERKPDFEIKSPLHYFCEVTTLNVSEPDKKQFVGGKSVALDQSKTVARIIRKIIDEKDEQIKYGASNNLPSVLVIFDYSTWSGLGTQLNRAFANFLFAENDGFRGLPVELSLIILIERTVLGGRMAINLKQSAVYQNPFGIYKMPDNAFEKLHHYRESSIEDPVSDELYLEF